MEVPDSRYFILEIIKDIAEMIKEQERNVFIKFETLKRYLFIDTLDWAVLVS